MTAFTDLFRGKRLRGRPQSLQNDPAGVALGVIGDGGDLPGREGGKVHLRIEQL
jgi:hypothetical protein